MISCFQAFLSNSTCTATPSSERSGGLITALDAALVRTLPTMHTLELGRHCIMDGARHSARHVIKSILNPRFSKLSVRSGTESKTFDPSDGTNPNREYVLYPVHYRSSQPLSQ